MIRRVRLCAMLLLVAATLLPLSTALAKGPPSKVTISGPGIDGEITVSDEATLEAFSFYQFNDLNRIMDEPPPVYGEGYKITRWVDQTNSRIMVWDTLTYYRDPAGGPGYIFFDGLNPAIGWTEGQGEWFLASEEGGAAMQRILAGHTTSTQAERSAAQGVTIGTALGLVALLAAAAWMVAIRSRREMIPA